MMRSKQPLYDVLYTSAIQQGWAGWGGNDRLAKLSDHTTRILAHPAVPRTGKLLEVGCGEGSLCRLLAQQGYEVTGVDISSVAIRWANEKNALHDTTIRYVHGDFSHCNFPCLDYFDVIVDGNCLHCILGERRSVFLNKVSVSLSERGIVVISSLCSQDARTHIMLRDGEPYRQIPPSDRLQKDVRQAGFEILHQYRHHHPYRKYDHINLWLSNTPRRPFTRHTEARNGEEYVYDEYGF